MKKQKKQVINRINYLLLLFLLAFFIRAIYAFSAYKTNVMANFNDDNAYMHYANSVVKQGPFVPDLIELGTYAGIVGPGIGWINSIPVAIFGSSWIPIFILNSLIGAITVILIYKLALLLTNETIAVLSSLYSTIYLFFIKYTATAGKEIWMTFFLILTIYYLTKALKENNFGKNTVLLALVFTIFIHIDERYLFYIPLLILLLVFFNNINFREGLKKAGVFGLLVFLFMLPWLIRNYKVYDRIVFVSVRTNSLTERVFGYEHKEFFEPMDNLWYLSPAQLDSVRNGSLNHFKDGINILPEQIKAIKNGRYPHSFTKLETMWASFKALWQPIDLTKGYYYQDGYRFRAWSFKHNLAVLLTFGWLLPFVVIGIYYLTMYYNRLAVFIFISFFFIHTLLHCLFIPFTEDRYRIPIDPLVIICAMSGLFFIVLKFIPSLSKVIDNENNLIGKGD